MVRRKAFTLVEVLIAAVIFCLILAGVYKLFIGGSKTAGKGQWINTTVDKTRNALNLISTGIENSTYPTTIFKDKIYDPCYNKKDPKVVAEYYLKLLKNGEPIKVPDSGQLKIMEWNVCEAEKPGSNGKLTKNQLFLEFKTKVGSSVIGNLVLNSESFTYETKAPDYAKSGKLNLKSKDNFSKVIVEDVEWVEFVCGGRSFPSKDCFDFFPISVKIRTLYPKDLNVFKENSIMATPQVAIDLL